MYLSRKSIFMVTLLNLVDVTGCIILNSVCSCYNDYVHSLSNINSISSSSIYNPNSLLNNYSELSELPVQYMDTTAVPDMRERKMRINLLDNNGNFTKSVEVLIRVNNSTKKLYNEIAWHKAINLTGGMKSEQLFDPASASSNQHTLEEKVSSTSTMSLATSDCSDFIRPATRKITSEFTASRRELSSPDNLITLQPEKFPIYGASLCIYSKIQPISRVQIDHLSYISPLVIPVNSLSQILTTLQNSVPLRVMNSFRPSIENMRSYDLPLFHTGYSDSILNLNALYVSSAISATKVLLQSSNSDENSVGLFLTLNSASIALSASSVTVTNAREHCNIDSESLISLRTLNGYMSEIGNCLIQIFKTIKSLISLKQNSGQDSLSEELEDLEASGIDYLDIITNQIQARLEDALELLTSTNGDIYESVNGNILAMIRIIEEVKERVDRLDANYDGEYSCVVSSLNYFVRKFTEEHVKTKKNLRVLIL